MTDSHGKYWTRQSGIYCQPDVCEPPKGQRPNNAHHAIWHFSREHEFEFYPNEEGWDKSGRYCQGECKKVTLCAVIQPAGTRNQSSIIKNFERQGYSTEGCIEICLDAYQEENKIAASECPELFPNGGSELCSPEGDFSILVNWRGRKWRIIAIDEHETGIEEINGESSAAFAAIAKEYRDINHERDATTELEGTYLGPKGKVS